ncbi:hypothetical protein ALC60_00433 [Trachymyrmex zeteki]|uniref:Uncharacterized protein n=1 Tax=Mycetomoellerius zeteki TaxID=64791 RepID=A0A151XJS2_9HYME|nr:hypothetical protein ALC60_00433 [Trachymyrmex zeteki]
MRGGAGDGPNTVTVPASTSVNFVTVNLFLGESINYARCRGIATVLSQPNYRCRLYHRYMGNRQLSNERGEPVQQVSQESGSRTQVTIDRVRLSVWLDQ